MSRPTPTANVAGDATRIKLIEGASASFYRHGVAKTTIDDVANEVRLSRRTVYRYFANKNELFLAVINRELEEISKECRLIYETSPFGEGLIEVALLMTRRVSESPTLSRMFAIDAAGETFEVLFGGHEFTASVERFLASFIRRAQKRGELRSDIKIADATEWITHLIFSLLAPNPMISEHDDAHVRFLLRTFVLPGLNAPALPQPPDREPGKRDAPSRSPTARAKPAAHADHPQSADHSPSAAVPAR